MTIDSLRWNKRRVITDVACSLLLGAFVCWLSLDFDKGIFASVGWGMAGTALLLTGFVFLDWRGNEWHLGDSELGEYAKSNVSDLPEHMIKHITRCASCQGRIKDFRETCCRVFSVGEQEVHNSSEPGPGIRRVEYRIDGPRTHGGRGRL
jgi:hypothetical protein